MSVDQKFLDMAKDLASSRYPTSKFGATAPVLEEESAATDTPLVPGLEAYFTMAREFTAKPKSKRKLPFMDMAEEFAGNRAERLLRNSNLPSPYQQTDSYGQERVRAVAVLETPRVLLQAPFSEADLQGALYAIYKQIFGNTYVMESERPVFAESQLRNGALTVRGFISYVVKTEAFKTRFFYKASQNRFIELNFKLLLGRAPYNQAEISEHVARYNAQGYDAEMDSYLNSQEYLENFGEDTVPYNRGFKYQVGQTGPAFSRMIDLYDGYATSDSDRAQIGQVARLTEDLSKLVKQEAPPSQPINWIPSTYSTSEAYTRYQYTLSTQEAGARTRAASETSKVELRAPFSNEEFQIALRAIYRQVLGNMYVMESERPIVAESQLKEGKISVRGFVRELVKSEVYMNRFLYKNSQTRFIELNYKLLLGRAPYNQQEISEHIARYNTQGYEAEMDSYLDSEEYQNMFGEDTVPYHQGFKTQTGQSMEAFDRMTRLYDGYAGSDRGGQVARLSESLGLAARRDNPPSYVYTPIPYTPVPSQPISQPISYRSATYKLAPYEPTKRPVETTQVMLQVPFSNEEFQVALRAIYRQVLGNMYVMESERPLVAESQLKEGKLTVRGFIRELVKSEVYQTRLFSKHSQSRFVELNFKLLLGRAPYDQQEIAEHVARYSTQGYDAEMDSYLDSEEYLSVFGEDIVPYNRGFNTQTGQSIDGFNRMASLYNGYAGTDTDHTVVRQIARLTESLGRSIRLQEPTASYDYLPTPYQPTKRLETSKVELRAPFSEQEFQVALRAIYRQILGNTHVMESERPIAAESQLRNRELTVRGFINCLVKSEVYMNRFFYANSQNRFVELNFKLLLGRAPYDQQEISEHVARYSAEGYGAEMDSYLDSEEYLENFGEDTVPYFRGFETQKGQNNDSFNRMVRLYDGYAGSDLSGQAARLTRSLNRTAQMIVRPKGRKRAKAALESPKVMLQAPFSEEQFQEALRAIYRQVFGNTYVMESEQPIAAESQLRNGELTVRGFISCLAKSEVYMNRFFYKSSQNRFIELNFKLLLGRAPYDQQEIAQHVARYSAEGYDAEIDSYLNSEEYLSAFGEDTVPYYRGFDTQKGQNTDAFNRMVRLYDGYAGSDTDRARSGQVARLTESLTRSTNFQPSSSGEIVPFRQDRVRAKAALETAKVVLRAPFSEEELQTALRAIYRQILGNTHVMESERPIAAESQLRNGELTVRGFISCLVNSEVYMNRFFYGNSQNRFVELNFKLLLGRAPYDQQEISEHVARYSAQGYVAEIDSYLNSEEYLENFGEDTVPYYRGFETQKGQNTDAFNRMVRLYDGYAGSDLSRQGARLTGNLAQAGY
jgi:5-carboxymethyl-2-hydroxymuconate isomerase/RNase P/RNase MRP subunit POP5